MVNFLIFNKFPEIFELPVTDTVYDSAMSFANQNPLCNITNYKPPKETLEPIMI